MLALLTEEQEMLREMAAKLAASAGATNPHDLGTVDRTKGWRSLAEAGLLSLRVRDASGRPAASGVDVMLVAEALSAALSPLPFAGSLLASDLLSAAGAPDAWLDSITSGQERYGLLLSADLLGLAHVDHLVDAVGWDVDQAAYVLARAGSPDAPTVVRLPLGEAFSPVESADLTRALVRAGATVGAEVAEPAGGGLTPEAYTRWQALALTTVCADAVGAMRSGLQGVVEYSKERIQYGVPIGSFQAIQHLCAEALVQTEGAASATKFAAWAVDELEPAEALLAARTAKAYTCSVARQVPETVMQVYGGIGQTWEHIAHLFTRRALLDRVLFGDQNEQLSRIADARLGAR